MSGEVVGAGSRSTVHAYGRDAVAKVPFESTPDSWIRHEANYSDAVRAVGAPAPRVLDIIEIDGRTVSVYERVRGPSMWQYVRQHPEEAAAMGRLLADLHSGITRLTPTMLVPRQRDRLACKIRNAARTVDSDLLGAIRLIPPDAATLHLCHGDLHPGNVIMAAAGPVVIDWFDTCRGEITGDVTRSSLLMGAGDDELTTAHLPDAAAETLRAIHDAYVGAMVDQFSISRTSFANWRRIEAAARTAEGIEVREVLEIWRAGEPPGHNRSGHHS